MQQDRLQQVALVGAVAHAIRNQLDNWQSFLYMGSNKSAGDFHRVRLVCVSYDEDSKQAALKQKAVGNHSDHEKPETSRFEA